MKKFVYILLFLPLIHLSCRKAQIRRYSRYWGALSLDGQQ